jgi:lipoyl-dependent peroxiredoxin
LLFSNTDLKGATMATAERQARVLWEGPLAQGSGELEFASSGIGKYPVTWASRVERPDGRTSPEELLAASHAACYAMAFSARLGRDGNPPERLDVTATVSLDPKEGGGFEVTSSALEVRGAVPGLDQPGFQAAAEQAEQECPISNALRNNLRITVNATLES